MISAIYDNTFLIVIIWTFFFLINLIVRICIIKMYNNYLYYVNFIESFRCGNKPSQIRSGP